MRSIGALMSSYIFSVIIPVCNNWEYTRDCLRSLREHTPGSDFEVIVVDNASTDATQSELEPLGRALFGQAFAVIRNSGNENFGPACNRGAQKASAGLLFFLNNDTLLMPGWCEPLLQALAGDASLGAVGPLLLYADNTVQHLGITHSIKGFSHLYSRFPADHPAVARPRDLQFITGAALLLEKSVFEEAGRFHEGYRNGMEDIELGLRIRQQGKRLRCIAESRIIHYESKTVGRHDHNASNARLFSERCGADIYPDMHLHGAHDGFLPVLNDWLGLSLQVPPRADAALRREAMGKPYDHLYDVVAQNPYWLWGNETLGKVLEEAGLCMEAAYYYGWIMLYRPMLVHARSLLQVTRMTGNTQVVGHVAEEFRALSEFVADREGQVRFLQTEINAAAKRNDAALQQILQYKLDAMACRPVGPVQREQQGPAPLHHAVGDV